MSEFTKDHYDNAELKSLTPEAHVLKFSGMYLGLNELSEYNELVYDTILQKMQSRSISYVAAIMTQIKEIYDNCADEYNRCKGEMGETIKINIVATPQGHKFVVNDNARGFPNEEILLKAFTELRTGSNFDNKAETSKAGTYGLGATLVNITSVWFKVVSINHNGDRITLICTDNMTNIDIKTDKAPSSAARGTTVEYIPDYKLFGIDDLEPENDSHIDVLYTRLMNISIAYPGMKIIFNGKTIKANNFKDYIKHFSDKAVILMESDRVMVAVYPTDGYEFTHIVNGLLASEGGNLNDYIVNGIVNKFTERLQKSYKKLTTTAIKSKLGIVSILRDVKGLKYSSQTKEKISNNYTSTDLSLLPFGDFAEQLNKSKNIRDGIVELYRIQQEMEKRAAANGLKAEVKEVFNPKLLKATKQSVFTMIAEGDSAVDGLPQVFGREYITYMPLSGKLLNCVKSTPQTLRKNARVMDIVNAVGLGLEETKSEGIIIAVDKDTDGIGHIKSLIISLLYTIHPQMLKDGKVFYLDTPIMSITDKDDKLIKWYSTLEDYQADFDNIPKNTNHNYNKGLGSTKPEDFKLIKDTDGFESMLVQIEYDEALHEQTILNWMSDETVDVRKEMLATESFYINDI